LSLQCFFVHPLDKIIKGNTVFWTGKYMCLYPNGTWLQLTTVDTRKLDAQCEVIGNLKNNTDCPCDINKLEQLYAVRYSLVQFYCFYPDRRLIQMNMLEPNATSKTCLTSSPPFVVPLVVSVSIAILIIITVIFVAVYRRKKPADFRQMIACLDPRLLTGILMALLSKAPTPSDEETIVDISFDAFVACYNGDWCRVDREVVSKLCDLGLKIITDQEILPGTCMLEALLEITKRYRSIVLFLSPEFVTDEWCCTVARQCTVSQCHLVPIIYRPFEISNHELMFTNILKHYLPMNWSEEVEQQERILLELRDRLMNDTQARIVH